MNLTNEARMRAVRWRMRDAEAGYLAGVESLRQHAVVPADTVAQTEDVYAHHHASANTIDIASGCSVGLDEAETFAYSLLALVGEARAAAAASGADREASDV